MLENLKKSEVIFNQIIFVMTPITVDTFIFCSD